MCDCIEDVAAAAGLVTRDAEGRCLFTGQAFRIGGCRHQARHMVQVPSIMAMARWDSHIVLRYLKEASLATITAEYMRGARAFKGQAAEDDKVKKAKKFSEKTLTALNDLRTEVANHDKELQELNAKMAIMDEVTSPKFVISDKYKKWHICTL